MSADNASGQAARKKRVQGLKKMIVLTFVISVLVPWGLCMVLFGKVNNLEQKLTAVSNQLSEVTDLLSKQQEQENGNGRLSEANGDIPDTQVVESLKQNGPDDGATDVQDTVSGGDHEEKAAHEEEIAHKEESAHKVYLTFDDGPGIYTMEILDILDRYDVKATFFVVGKEDEYSQELLTRIVESGHTLGMHSYSHVYKDIYNSVEDFSADFHKLQDYLYEVTGVMSSYYRFPGGSSNTVTDINIVEFADYLEMQGVEYYDWNISSGDSSSNRLRADTIVNNCIKDIMKRDVSIILMHDAAGKGTTVDALPLIIEYILDMEDTVILPITEDTIPIQHIK